jgi:hypothetical protein
MRNAILFVLFTLSLASAVQAETNYCHDQATNRSRVVLQLEQGIKHKPQQNP